MPFSLEPFRVYATEAKLGHRLPSAYRASMINANGGLVEIDGEGWWLHPILDDSDVRRLKRTCNDVVRETAEARTWTNFPSSGVAIAHNGSGDSLLFLPGDSGDDLRDRVFRWCHETGSLDVVAESFDVLTWRPS